MKKYILNSIIHNITTVLSVIWLSIPILELLFLMIWLRVNGLQTIWFPIGLLVLWFVITAISVKLSDLRKKRKQRRERRLQEEYQSKYWVRHTFTDERFGEIGYQWDTLRQAIAEVEQTISDLSQTNEISVCSRDRMDEAQSCSILSRALAFVCDHRREIFDRCCETVKEYYDDEDIRDENDELITLSFITKDFSLDSLTIFIDPDNPGVEWYGGMETDFGEHVAEHGLTASIDLNTGEIECYSG